jgi:hypothetical protein
MESEIQIDIAGDELTMPQTAAALSQIAGRFSNSGLDM